MCSDTACRRCSVYLLERRGSKFSIHFYNIRNILKYERKSSSIHLMNCKKIGITLFSLAIFRWFGIAIVSFFLFFVKDPIISEQWIMTWPVIWPILPQDSSHSLGISLKRAPVESRSAMRISWYVASLRSFWLHQKVTQYLIYNVCDAQNSNYWQFCLTWQRKACNSLSIDTLFEALSVQTTVVMWFWAAKFEAIVTTMLAIMGAPSSLRILRFTNRTNSSMNTVTAAKLRTSFSARRPSKGKSFSLGPLEIVGVRPPGAWYEAPIYYM
jgi:hypothetical protein